MMTIIELYPGDCLQLDIHAKAQGLVGFQKSLSIEVSEGQYIIHGHDDEPYQE